VESLGATFLDLGIRGEETEGGYAAELTPEQQNQQQAALEERLPEFDVVITTAAVPGRPAPKLIPATAVRAMRPGSVIVDLAAETGGNCELTKPGEETVDSGVTIVGLVNLPSTMPAHASQLYARNVMALLQHLAPEGELKLDWDDEITCVIARGRGVTTSSLIELTVDPGVLGPSRLGCQRPAHASRPGRTSSRPSSSRDHRRPLPTRPAGGSWPVAYRAGTTRRRRFAVLPHLGCSRPEGPEGRGWALGVATLSCDRFIVPQPPIPLVNGTGSALGWPPSSHCSSRLNLLGQLRLGDHRHGGDRALLSPRAP
jgi:hypothetical protein